MKEYIKPQIDIHEMQVEGSLCASMLSISEEEHTGVWDD